MPGDSKPDEDKSPEPEPASTIDILDRAINSIQKRFSSEGMKATVGEFIRLLEVQKQLQADQPKEIKVTWIEPDGMEYASENDVVNDL